MVMGPVIVLGAQLGATYCPYLAWCSAASHDATCALVATLVVCGHTGMAASEVAMT